MDHASSHAHRQFGDFLRSRRERIQPEQVGLTDHRRRRAKGLRRDEVASLAGISAEWYVKLEQGRAVAPSSTTVEALARALRLDEGERAHLCALAKGEDRSASAPEQVSDPLRCLVESLPNPAYVLGLRSDVLAWNEAASDLFPELRLADGERNILRYVLTTAAGRRLFGPCWADEARRVVAMFRAAYDLHSADPAFAGLLEELQAGCPELADWWNSHAIATPESGAKTLLHPVMGEVRYSYTTLQANDDRRLKLVCYLPLQDRPHYRPEQLGASRR